MASKKNLKKEINNVLSNVIEECYAFQLKAEDKIANKADKIIDEAITTFDDFIEKFHSKDVDNYKKHFNQLNGDLKLKASKLLEKLEKLKA